MGPLQSVVQVLQCARGKLANIQQSEGVMRKILATRKNSCNSLFWHWSSGKMAWVAKAKRHAAGLARKSMQGLQQTVGTGLARLWDDAMSCLHFFFQEA